MNGWADTAPLGLPTHSVVYEELAVLALLAFAYCLISGKISRLPVSGPILFVAAGLALGPAGLGWLADDVGRTGMRILVDLTLAVILFSDAANANFSVLRRQWELPARLLLLGLPLAIGLGLLAAAWLFSALTLYEAAILGTMLAATDAALGKAVVTNQTVPARIREGLNCESGLNDGLSVPFLLLFIALAHGEAGESPVSLVAREIGVGVVIGMVIALAGALLLRKATARGWVDDVWLQVAMPALAFACFALADMLDGSGYIAAFVGGMVFGSHLKDDLPELVRPAEGIGEGMAMLTWVLFGVGVIATSIQHMTLEVFAYVLLSLTVIRMLPVFVAMVGSGERWDSRLFMGWFGPRGLASIVFTIMVLNENLPGSELIATVVTCTVGISLVCHGISANPLARWLARRERLAAAGGVA